MPRRHAPPRRAPGAAPKTTPPAAAAPPVFDPGRPFAVGVEGDRYFYIQDGARFDPAGGRIPEPPEEGGIDG